MLFTNLICDTVRHASFLSRPAVKAIREALNTPKRPSNAYALFYADRYRAMTRQGQAVNVTEAGRLVGSEWNALSDQEKKPYVERAEKLKQEFAREHPNQPAPLTERQKLAQSLVRLNRHARIGLLSRSDLNGDEREFLHELPQAGAVSGRGVFISSQLKGKHAPSGSLPSRLAEVSAEWQRLTPAQQEAFERQAADNVSKFKAAITAFLRG